EPDGRAEVVLAVLVGRGEHRRVVGVHDGGVETESVAVAVAARGVGDADLGAQAVAEVVGATAATGGDGLESGGGGVGGGGERGLRRHGCWRGGPSGWLMRDDGVAPSSGS